MKLVKGKEATISKMEIVQREGKRDVKRTPVFYNLDAIISVGFEHNDIVHSCYKKVGFVDKAIVPHERENIIEMAITKEEFV